MHSRKKTERALKNSIDILLLVLCFLVSAFLAKKHAGLEAGFFRLGVGEIYFLLFLCLAWNMTARIFGLYDEFRSTSLGAELGALSENILLQVASTTAVLFVAKSQALSRFFVFTNGILLLAMLVSWRIFFYLLFTWLQKNGNHLSRILIVGSGSVAMGFADTIEANAQLGYQVRGFVGSGPKPDGEPRWLGTIDQLAQVIEREKVDEVVIALPHSDMEKFGDLIDTCENFPVRVRIIPDYFRFMSPRFGISRLGMFPLISIRANPLEQLGWQFCKRFFDLAFTLLLFVGVFSWLWPLLILLIKMTSPGPIFFKQERWGIKNRRIVCYKFRSMVKESRDVDEHGHYLQATRGDQRVTRLGSFLRRSNLDELPQFINVLKGEMSVIGPRPHPTPMNLEAKNSIRKYQLRHLVKPGITGWAQVNGFRGETCNPDLLRKRVEYDLWYIENWSLLLDLRIVWLSFWCMLKGDPRAY